MNTDRTAEIVETTKAITEAAERHKSLVELLEQTRVTPCEGMTVEVAIVGPVDTDPGDGVPTRPKAFTVLADEQQVFQKEVIRQVNLALEERVEAAEAEVRRWRDILSDLID